MFILYDWKKLCLGSFSARVPLHFRMWVEYCYSVALFGDSCGPTSGCPLTRGNELANNKFNADQQWPEILLYLLETGLKKLQRGAQTGDKCRWQHWSEKPDISVLFIDVFESWTWSLNVQPFEWTSEDAQNNCIRVVSCKQLFSVYDYLIIIHFNCLQKYMYLIWRHNANFLL